MKRWIKRDLKKERESLNISFMDLAIRSGFKESTVQWWEAQKRFPKYALKKLELSLAGGPSATRALLWTHGKIYAVTPFSKRLRELMEAQKLSRQALCAKIGCSENCVSVWLRGGATPSDAYIRKLSDLLGEDFCKFMKPLKISNPVGAFLYKKRIEKGLTVMEVCKALGRSEPGAWEKWMAGTCAPNAITLEKLRPILDLTEGDIKFINGQRKGCAPRSQSLKNKLDLSPDSEWMIRERLSRKLSQVDFSKLIGYTNPWVCMLESGRVPISDKLKMLIVRKLQKYDSRNKASDDNSFVVEEARAAASREEVIRVPKQSLDQVRKMAEEFRRRIPTTIKKSEGDDKYATRDKNFISLLMKTKIHKILEDAPLRFLNLPNRGREIVMFKDSFKLDMHNSLGMEKDALLCAEIKKLFLQRKWDMPIELGDVDDYILTMKSNPFNLIHLDYCGTLTRSKLAAVNHLIRITDNKCLIFLTLNTHPRAKYPVFYETGKPPFDAPIAWHQPYFGCDDALMEVFMVHLNPGKVEVKPETGEFMVPAGLADVFTKRGWESITEQYMKADIEKRMEVFKAVSEILNSK
jgi:transcriptional regulator with XRE-family HTH domain